MGGSGEGGVGGVEGGVEGDFGDGGSAGSGFSLASCLSGSVRLSRIIRIMRPRAIGMLSSGFVPARRGQHPMLSTVFGQGDRRPLERCCRIHSGIVLQERLQPEPATLGRGGMAGARDL